MTVDDFTPEDLLSAMIECANNTYEHMSDYYDNLPEYDSDSKEGRRQKSAKYRVKYPERIKARSMNNRAIKVRSVGNAQAIREMYNFMEGRCGYCGMPVFWDIPKDVQIDHIVPLDRGGSNHPTNLIVSCPYCNLNKSDKFLEQWKRDRGW
jgi:5-methylcytosine-specific restriction endonuclease McrA